MAYAILALGLNRMKVHPKMHLADDFSNIPKKSPIWSKLAIHSNLLGFGAHLADDPSY